MLSSDSTMRAEPSPISQTWGNRVDLSEISEDILPSNDPFHPSIENVEVVPSIKFLPSKHFQKTRKSIILYVMFLSDRFQYVVMEGETLLI